MSASDKGAVQTGSLGTENKPDKGAVQSSAPAESNTKSSKMTLLGVS